VKLLGEEVGEESGVQTWTPGRTTEVIFVRISEPTPPSERTSGSERLKNESGNQEARKKQEQSQIFLPAFLLS
jgi:hypothetical protein